MDIKKYMRKVGFTAKEASAKIATATSEQKNIFLENLAERIINHTNNIIKTNKEDIRIATKNNSDNAFIDRLTFNESNIKLMADGLLKVAKLNDPIGETLNKRKMPSGIEVAQMRVPLGVIGMIYESRPNVTIDAAALAIKSGNSIILRGGSESINTNNYLALLIKESLITANIPEGTVQIIETTDRAAVTEMITQTDFIDVIIPRGGKSLIEKISSEAKVQVIKHLDGNCHIYIDEYANIEQAIRITDNSKTQRFGTCNTLESLIVNSRIAALILPEIKNIFDKKSIEIRGCNRTIQLIPGVINATEDDFYEEYLGPTISCKIVDSIDEAIHHINKYSSAHTESIITENNENATKFMREIDSSSVMVNASTRFADGFEYGLGAEIGISTDKFHARGPVGLEGLTSLKYIVFGSGQIRT
ncbi:MAG: glutamate-5-semialdehyde dehydrogenase [Methylophilaceae bacterium]|nr:glutamate-5-semialdehyde dehydrogenase [Methylophilaceae bacterium]